MPKLKKLMDQLTPNNILNQNDKKNRLAIYLASGGVLLFLVIAATFPFSSQLFKTLFPKPFSFASSNTYYVAAAGSDSNDCSTNSPCASIQQALIKASAGDTISVASGNYGPQTITGVNNGSSSSPITVSAQPGAVLTRANISDASSSAAVQQTPLLTVSNSSNLTLSGFMVTGMKTRSDLIPSAKPQAEVVIKNSGVGTGITINHFYLSNANATCLDSTNQPVSIKNSLFISCGQSNTDSGILAATTNVLIDQSEVSSSTGYGILMATSSAQVNPATGNILTNNLIQTSANYGIYLNGVSNANIKGNYFSNNAGASAINIAGDNNTITQNGFNNQALSVKIDSGNNNNIINNTLNFGGITLGSLAAHVTGTQIKNNLVVMDLYTKSITLGTNAFNTQASYNYLTWDSTRFPLPSTDADSQGNLINGPGTTFAGSGTGTSLPGFQSGLGSRTTTQNIHLSYVPPNDPNPKLVGAASDGKDIGGYCFSNCTAGTGKTVYVSPSGSDSYLCSQDWPCASIDQASLYIGPNDSLVVGTGTYTGQQVIKTNGSPQFAVNISAQPNAVLTYPNPATTAEQAKPRLVGGTNGISYLNISGLAVIGMKGRSDIDTHVWDTSPNGANGLDEVDMGSGAVHNNYDKMVFEHAYSTCLALPNSGSVTNSIFIDCGVTNNTQTHGVYATGNHPGDPMIVIKGNYFAGAAGYDIHCHAGSCDIEDNVTTGAGYDGIIADQPGSVVTNNIVYGNNTAGISINDGVYVANNIVANNYPLSAPPACCHDGITGGDTGNHQDITIVNNIIYGQTRYGLSMGMGGKLTIKNNILFNQLNVTGTPLDEDYNLMINSSLNTHGSTSGIHDVYTDPMVVDLSSSLTGSFRMNANAPTLDAINTAPVFNNVPNPTYSNQIPDLHLSKYSPAIAAGTVLPTDSRFSQTYGGVAPDIGPSQLAFNKTDPTPYTHPGSTQTFYVDSNGANGTSSCSQSSPCLSLLQASRLARPGDLIRVNPGTYNNLQYIEASGSASQPITINASGVTITRPTNPVSGISSSLNNTFQNSPLLTISNSQYLSLTGGTLTGMKGRSDLISGENTYPAELMVSGSDLAVSGNNTVQNLTVQHAQTNCITSDGEPVIISNNSLTDCGVAGNRASAISGPTTNIVVSGNTIDNASGYGINLGTATKTAVPLTSPIIANNTVSNIGSAADGFSGHGILIGGNFVPGNNAQVYGNNIFNSYNYGIWLQTVSNANVYNNILNSNKISNGQGGAIEIAGNANQIYNNTFYGQFKGIDLGYQGAATNSVIKNNIFSDNNSFYGAIGVHPSASTTNNLADYNLFFNTAAVGTTPDANGNAFDGGHSITSQDPKFVSPNTTLAADFHLQSNSPAIGKGLTTGLTNASIDLGALCLTNCVAVPTAHFSLNSSSTSYSTGSIIALKIYARSDTDSANLFAAKLTFPTNIFQVQSIDPTGSFVTSWVDQSFDNSAGTISIVGGVPNPGYKTSGTDVLVATVNLKATSAGSGSINFNNSSAIYRNSDNTNIATPGTALALTVTATSSPTPSPTATASPSPTANPTATPSSGPTASPSPTHSPTPSPSPTPTASPSPSPTPSPTPLPIACSLTSATWSNLATNPISSGTRATLTVNSVGDCAGKTISFVVVQDNGILPAGSISTNPSNSVFVGNTATASWTSEYQPDGPFGIFDPPEYYFTATLTSSTTGTSSAKSSDPELQVNNSGTPNPSPSPTATVGDGNNDKQVNLIDLSVMLSNFTKVSTQPDFPTGLDINNDGIINSIDFSSEISLLKANNSI